MHSEENTEVTTAWLGSGQMWKREQSEASGECQGSHFGPEKIAKKWWNSPVSYKLLRKKESWLARIAWELTYWRSRGGSEKYHQGSVGVLVFIKIMCY